MPVEQAGEPRVPAIPRTQRGAGGDGPQRRLFPSAGVYTLWPTPQLGR
jgi:hypothetical protein